MHKSTLVFKTPISDRHFGEHSIITKEFINVWKEVPQVLSYLKFDLQHGTLHIEVNWDDLVEKSITQIELNYLLDEYKDGKITEIELRRDIAKVSSIEMNFSLIINDELYNSPVDLKTYSEDIMFLFFIIFNLSTPGSINLYSPDLSAIYDKEIYKYSSEPFESGWIESIDNGWSLIKSIDLNSVLCWILKLKVFNNQVASSNTESALNAILNVCKIGDITPTKLIWISLALETLYDTPKGQISKTLLDRIILFLEIGEYGKKKFKKNIREFYDLRSKFVHGELLIPHPMFKNEEDKALLEYELSLMRNCDFGMALVIATIQKMIENNWTGISFTEQYNGVSE